MCTARHRDEQRDGTHTHTRTHAHAHTRTRARTFAQTFEADDTCYRVSPRVFALDGGAGAERGALDHVDSTDPHWLKDIEEREKVPVLDDLLGGAIEEEPVADPNIQMCVSPPTLLLSLPCGCKPACLMLSQLIATFVPAFLNAHVHALSFPCCCIPMFYAPPQPSAVPASAGCHFGLSGWRWPA